MTSDLLFGLVFIWFGQIGATILATSWAVVVGIAIGEKQSTSGGTAGIQPTFWHCAYRKVYGVIFSPIENNIIGKAEEILKRKAPGHKIRDAPPRSFPKALSFLV